MPASLSVDDLVVSASQTEVLLSIKNTRAEVFREDIVAREVLLGSNTRTEDCLALLRNLDVLRIANSISVMSMLTTVLTTLAKVLGLDGHALVLVEFHFAIAELGMEALLLTEALPHVELNSFTTSTFI